LYGLDDHRNALYTCLAERDDAIEPVVEEYALAHRKQAGLGSSLSP
jgi:hypothetical protein